MIFNGNKKLLISIVVLLLGMWFFVSGNEISAQSSDNLVITEIMYNPKGSNEEHAKWVEIKNIGSNEVLLETAGGESSSGWKIKNWKITDTSNHYLYNPENENIILASGDYLVITNSIGNFLSDYPSFNGLILKSAINLSSSQPVYALTLSKSDTVIDAINYFKDWGADDNGRTLEKIDLVGGNTRENWQESYADRGTPGAENSQPPPPVVYSKRIRINELLPDPKETPEKEYEFIELYNSDKESIDLNGWKIKDKSGEFELPGEVEPEGFAVFYDTVTLNNDGDQIDLFDPNGEVASSVSYGKAEENESYSWSGEEWKWSSLPTPGSENKFAEDIDYPDGLFISELLPDPSNSPEKDFEYVEIFNSEKETVDLSGWKLKDKSSSYTLVGIVDPEGFIIFYDTVSLNNGGDEIKLVNPLDKVVHTVSYEEAKENYSYSWKESENKWKWTSFLTPGSKNIFDEDIEYPKGLYLSEILPNPEGEEEKKEFIEIYNPLDKNVDLEKWALKDSGKTTKYVFPKDSEIGKKKYLVIYREDFKFALNNSGDEKVYLLNPKGEEVSMVYYEGSDENVSYNYNPESGKWRWSQFLTPGKENKFNKLPKIEVDIDDDIYKDTYAYFEVKANDPEKEKVKVTWDFGDGHKSYKKETRHKYEKEGKYKLSVKIFDGSEEVVKEYKIEVKKFSHKEVKVRALCPNPAGNDSENEWILVKNYSDDEINLKGWSVATGSKKLYNHPIYEDIKLKKGKSVKITREDSHFTLNNEKSKVELRYPDGEEAYKVKYDKGDDNTAEEDEVYEKTDSGWQWTKAQINADETQTSADTTQTDAEEVEEENFSEFLGGWSKDKSDKINREELLNYGTQIKLAAAIYSGEGKVLGVSAENYNEPIYRFAESAPGEHYATKFFKSVFGAINYSINKLISGFY